MRPILVRVMTDLYVQQIEHTAAERQHFADLVLRFLEATDIPTRANVAEKLAHCPNAPPEIMRRLARDVFTVAETVLRHSNVLGRAEFEEIAAACGGLHADEIAERFVVDRASPAQQAAPFARIAPASEPTECLQMIEEHEASLTMPTITSLEDNAPFDGHELGARFLAADTAVRLAILAAQPSEPKPSEWPIVKSDAALRRLETAALRKRPDDFAREIEQALSVSHDVADHIVKDETGEALVVALKVLEFAPNVVLRILLFLSPHIGESVDRVFELAQLYERVELTAALAIVASWQRLAGERRVAAYQPALAPDATPRGLRDLWGAIADSLEADPAKRPDAHAEKGQGTT